MATSLNINSILSDDSSQSGNSSKFEEKFINNKTTQQEDIDVDIQVQSYAPRVFRFIRAIDQISEFDIMKSVKP